MSCVTFVPAQDEDQASVAVWSLDFSKQQHKLCNLLADGAIENFDVIQRTAYLDEQGDEFKRDFVKSMLKRLNLTAADLPGINLEPILGAGRELATRCEWAIAMKVGMLTVTLLLAAVLPRAGIADAQTGGDLV